MHLTVELLENDRGDGILKEGASTATPHNLIQLHKCQTPSSSGLDRTKHVLR